MSGIAARVPWPAGTVIVQHEIWRGRPWSARPMTVVEDRADLLVLWFPHGTRWKVATTPPSRERAPTRAERFALSLSLGDWVLTDVTWDASTLVLVRPGDWHATWVSWRASGEEWGWYVNFQRPFVRAGRGIQTMDLMLDITVELDGRWHWKDEAGTAPAHKLGDGTWFPSVPSPDCLANCCHPAVRRAQGRQDHPLT